MKKYQRRQSKGQSRIDGIADYTVIDLETTGLSPDFDEIIEFSAIRVRDGQVSETFSSFSKPSFDIPPFITQLTGITMDDLCNAPEIEEVLPAYLDFIGSDVVLGHNVHFDVNFIYDFSEALLNRPFCNDMIDTMRLGRRILPNLGSHRLADVAKALHVVPDSAHRGLVDCQTTYSVYETFKASYPDSFSPEFHTKPLNKSRYHLDARNIVAVPGHENPDNPLYGAICVFTGTLERMTRKEAMQLVVNIGGTCGNGVTAKTNFLILGNNDYCSTIKGGKSSKQKKAEDLMQKGYDIKIIPENVFYDLISL